MEGADLECRDMGCGTRRLHGGQDDEGGVGVGLSGVWGKGGFRIGSPWLPHLTENTDDAWTWGRAQKFWNIY